MSYRKHVDDDVNILAAIIRHSQELMMLADLEGTVVLVNEAGERTLGLDPEKAYTTNIIQFIPDYLRSFVENKLLPTLLAGGFWEGELQYINLTTGDLIDVWALTFTIDDRITGKPKYFANISTDISEKKKAERELREKEERLGGITKNIPGVVYEFYATRDFKYRLSYASERMQEIFGISGAMTDLFSVFLNHVHQEDKSRFLDSIYEAVKGCVGWDFEGRFVKPSGETIWFHGLSTPTRREDQIVFYGILLDITGRKRAEEHYRDSEDKFRKVFMTVPSMIAITRLEDGLIFDVNQGFEEITGWNRNEVVAKGLRSLDLNFWVNTAEREGIVRDIKAGIPVHQRECQFRRIDGAVRDGIYSARAIDVAGEQCLLFVLADVTEKKLLEAEHRRLEQQLFQSQKMDAIGQLAGGIAHDFNNILTGIQGNVSMMLMGYPEDHPMHKRLLRIEEQVSRGANLTKQLLGFAREGKYELKSLSINEVLRKGAKFFAETRKEIEVEFDFQENCDPVEVDLGQIEQVFLNLYINAGQAMARGGRLSIQTRNVKLQETQAVALKIKPGNFVQISVRDTGTGMDEETKKRAFDPFFTTKAKEGGTGLGLASAYGILRNHGGAITVASEVGKGATFTIYLPSSNTGVTEEVLEASKKLVPGTGGVLVVDDEILVLEVVAEMLKALGYTVYTAQDGKEAVSIYQEKQNRIDLVILDMIMPGTSGFQVLMLLKDIDPDVKVLLASGYGLQGEVRDAMKLGCCGFIHKPFNSAEISSMVNRVLSGQSNSPEEG